MDHNATVLVPGIQYVFCICYHTVFVRLLYHFHLLTNFTEIYLFKLFSLHIKIFFCSLIFVIFY